MDCYLDVFNIPELHPAFRALHFAKFAEEASLPSLKKKKKSTGGDIIIELNLKSNNEGDDEGEDVKKPANVDSGK